MKPNLLLRFLTHSCTRHPDLDAPETTLCHSRIIRQKPFLRRVYEIWYKAIAAELPADVPGPVLELGSGGGFMEQFIPDLITSEILDMPDIDIRLDAAQLPFRSGSLRAVVMLDVFHHIPDVAAFLTEAGRCIKPGGAIIMVEPWITRWSLFVYTYLHHEPVRTDVRKWSFAKGKPLSESNSALPWIVFHKDKARFEKQFPQWHATCIVLHTPFLYLLSGGLSYRNFVPFRLFDLCRGVEALLGRWMKYLAMFATIVARRTDYPSYKDTREPWPVTVRRRVIDDGLTDKSLTR